jgi:hypothetical protein
MGDVMMVRGGRSRGAAVLVGALVVAALAGGCAPEGSLERLDSPVAPSAEALVASDRFAEVLDDLERRVAVDGPSADGAASQSARTTVDEVVAGTALGSQARAFFEAHTTQVERDARPAGLADVSVEVADVVETHDDDGPVALVTVETVRSPADGAVTTDRASYAVSWEVAPAPASPPGSASPSDEAGEGGAPGDQVRLTEVRALHDDDGHPAVLDPEGSSALGVATDYVRALRSGSARDVDAYEGGVRSSADLREAMRARLAASGRSTAVEVPCGRTGTVQLVYVVLDGDVPPLRLEVDVSGHEPVVNAYL